MNADNNDELFDGLDDSVDFGDLDNFGDFGEDFGRESFAGEDSFEKPGFEESGFGESGVEDCDRIAEAQDNDAFERKMAEEMQDMETGKNRESAEFLDERLREMNKKLPEWSLEPPFSIL